MSSSLNRRSSSTGLLYVSGPRVSGEYSGRISVTAGFFLNGKGTLEPLLDVRGGDDGPAVAAERGGGGVASSSSPSSGEEVACRLRGLGSGVRAAGRFEDDSSITKQSGDGEDN